MKLFFKTRNQRFIPYSRRLLSAMMVVTIIVASIIGVTLCQIAVHLIHNTESALVQKNMQMVSQNMGRAMEVADAFAVDITSSGFLRSLCLEDSVTKESLEDLEAYLEHQVQLSEKEYGIHASFINVYLKNGVSHSLLGKLPYTDYESCVQYYEELGYISPGKYTPMTWVDSVQHQDISGKKINSVVWIRFVYDSITMEKIGVVVGGISEAVFKDIFGIFPHAYLYQENGKILSSTDAEMLSDIVDAELLSQINSAHTPIGTVYSASLKQRICFWKDSYFSFILVVPERTLQTELQDLTRWYVLWSIVVIAVGVLSGTLVNYFLTKRLSKSIYLLTDTVQRVDRGELGTRFEHPMQNDEIAYLGEHFNHMLDSLERIYEEQEREALGRKDLEIQLLQSQINPHLLYNTLNSVALAVRNDEQQTAQDLVYTLSDFIRLSLASGHSTVTLAAELELLKKYILVQKLASHRNILLDIQVPEELLSAIVIRTSLQPIVENAVLHGLAGYRDDGCIQIRAKLNHEDNTMDVYIRDNGLGIDEDTLVELNRAINKKDYKEMCSHFGLYNVNWRIKYTWGSEEYGITIDSEESDYTEVKIHLPYVKKEGV